MADVVIGLGQYSVAVTIPEYLLKDGILASLRQASAATSADKRIVVSEEPDRRFALSVGRRRPEAGLSRGRLLIRLLDVLADQFAAAAQMPTLRAAAVARGDGAILIAGPALSGKSSLAAWFLEKGFALIADSQVAILDEMGSLAGYPAPLSFPAAGADHLVALGDIATAPMARTPERILIGIKPKWMAERETHPCRLMVFPRHVRDGRARLELLDTLSAALFLKRQSAWTGSASDNPGLWPIRMAQNIPAIALSYSDYDEIDGLIDRLARLTLDEKLPPAAFARFVTGIGQPPAQAQRKFPVPERSDRNFSPFLTIGMATYDDFDGVYFSLQAIRLYHAEILDEVEFIIIDNHPDGRSSAALKRLEGSVPNLRYLPVTDMTGTAVKGRIFSEASGDFVLCMDCHVLFSPGSLRKLIDYFRTSPLSNDLIQGPLLRDNLTTISTHWADKWRDGMFGVWANDSKGAAPENPPFEIGFQGLGVFACRRVAWPGLNPAFRGFGGEEAYLHEKFRQAGGRVLCLPALRWVHRFERPRGPPYPNRWEDRIRNYVIGFREVGWPTDEMQAHFRERLGRSKADRIFAAVTGELDGVAPAAAVGPDGDDVPYDLRQARLSFVAEIAVPILLKSFAVKSAACVGCGAALWMEEFSRHGVPAAVIEPSAEMPARRSPPRSLACCFEAPDISAPASAEKLVQWLTSLAPVVLFVLAPSPSSTARSDKRRRDQWTALFARNGYTAVDHLGAALADDPRVDTHYRLNIALYSRQAQRQGKTAKAGRTRPSVRDRKAETGVSVVLPVFDGATYLASAIESILLQRHRHFELIVVNDGSTDNSGAIAEAYAKVDRRVRVIHQDKRGVAAATNAGAAKARFALLARFDHDDVALPDRLALQVAFMAKHEDIAAVGGAMRYIDGEGKLTGASYSPPLTPEACHEALADATIGPIANPTVMIRKAVFEKLGGYRPQFRYASDLDLWLRMDEEFKLANLPDMLVDYRGHGGNMTVRHRFDQALNAHIARQAAFMRRRGLPDPIDGWTTLDLDKLAAFAMPDEEIARVYRELFDAALSTFAKTRDEACLHLAHRCLVMVPSEIIR